MSGITTVYDALVSRIETVLPSHNRLPNPYQVEENDRNILEQGYGLAISSGENTERNISCRLSVGRTFIVTLTRDFFALENDVTTKASAEKQLMEDQYLLINDIESEPELGTSGVVLKAQFVSDNGIDFVLGDRDNFLKLETLFLVEYFEQL